METKNKTGFIVSVIAAVALMVGGVMMMGHFLNMIPDSGNISWWKFTVYAAAALIPILVSGFWLGALYRRSRRRGDRPGVGNGIVFGVILILIGLFMLSFSAGLFPVAWRPVFISWPMLLIVLGLIEVFKLHIIPGFMLVVVGNFFLVPRIARVYPESWWFGETFVSTYWPILLIAFGVLIILAIAVRPRYFRKNGDACGHNRGEHRRAVEEAKKMSREYSEKAKQAGREYAEEAKRMGREYAEEAKSRERAYAEEGVVDYNLIFTGAEQVFLDPVFRGGEINTVFAGITLDLRKTTLPEGTTYLEVSTVFGGVNIFAPSEWRIEIRNQSMVGGFNDKRPAPIGPVDEERKLIIVASCVFGGGEVK